MSHQAPQSFRYRSGELIAILSEREIRATLDDNGRLNGLPFMPEMVKYCGKAFRVHARTDNLYVEHQRTWVEIDQTVLLDTVCCDGSAHGGCQMGCLLLWNEAWLKPATPTAPRAEASPTVTGAEEFPSSGIGQLLAMDAKADRCQAALIAEIGTPHPRRRSPYLRAAFTREVTIRQLLRGLRWAFGLRHRKSWTPAPRQPTAVEENLQLQPGQWVEVKRRAEIEATLDAGRKHRGLTFTPEMSDYCGKRFRVARRIEKMVREDSGKLRMLKDTVALEGAHCKGSLVSMCPRRCPHLWREAWLRRVS